ncbi:hypothetical protein Tco_0785475 [Tanacetum coccineum]
MCLGSCEIAKLALLQLGRLLPMGLVGFIGYKKLGNLSFLKVKGSAANVQCYNRSEKGLYAPNCPKPRVRDSKYFMEQMLLAKQNEEGVAFTDEHNDFLVVDATRMEDIEELNTNIYLMARI